MPQGQARNKLANESIYLLIDLIQRFHRAISMLYNSFAQESYLSQDQVQRQPLEQPEWVAAVAENTE